MTYAQGVRAEAGLAAYWPFDGTLVDAVGGIDGTASGGAIRYIEGPVSGNALALDSGRYVTMGPTPILDTHETTVTFFFQLLEAPTDGYNPCLVAKRDVENKTRFSIHVRADRGALAVWNGISVRWAALPEGPFEVGRWHHVAVASSRYELEVYVDGARRPLSGGGSFNLAFNNQPLVLGASTPQGEEQCPCALDELAFYDRALPAETIAALVDAAGWSERRARAAAAAENLLTAEAQKDKERQARHQKAVERRLNDPALVDRGETRIYEGEHLGAIRLPVGGIGAGCIQMDGQGKRAVWQIFNNHTQAVVPHSFMAIRALTASGEPVVRVLQTEAVGPFVPMKALTFRGEYPFGWYDFIDDALSVAVQLEVFSPLIPLDARDSGIPCAIFSVRVRNEGPEPVDVSLLAAQQNAAGFTGNDAVEARRHRDYGGNRNRVVTEGGLCFIEMTSDKRADMLGAGTMALAVFADDATYAASWDTVEELAKTFAGSGALANIREAGPTLEGETVDGALSASFKLEVGAERTTVFAVAWHFPNEPGGRWAGEGVMYANWWPDAAGVVRDLRDRLPELTRLTRLYHDTFYASNLPQWLLDRVSSQVAILRTPTVYWAKDGYFGGWEGCSRSMGCCPGNCNHVWHYAQAHARLFPEIGRRMREQGFGFQRENGSIPMRQPSTGTAVDGQCGDILGAYREHLSSSDGAWLEEHWPHIQRAMDYLIRTHDPDEDGLLEGPQHNTLDGEMGGCSSWLGSLYLAALSACEQMALIEKDVEAGARYARIRRSGEEKQNTALWNGEFYIHLPGPDLLEDYASGCGIDQVLGEWWVKQLDLPPLYPLDRVQSALRSLLKYNFRDNFAGVDQVPRKFVADPDAGMQMIVWPDRRRPTPHTRYADEVMTGFEYAAAANMVQHGLLKEGYMVAKAVADRYDGRLRTGLTESDYASWGYSGNPFGDDEAGKYYARAMSVWSLLLASQGFIYDGPRRRIGFQPVWRPEDHASFFTTAEGWGIFRQKRSNGVQSCRFELSYGRLPVQELIFALPGGADVKGVSLRYGGKEISAAFGQAGQAIVVRPEAEILVEADMALDCELRLD
jgi:non-lysosomal glucosylceramidase